MKILLLEYITAGGLSGMPLPASLLREGTLMRDALFSDFSAIADIEIVTTYDARLDFPKVSAPKPSYQAISIDNTSNATEIWQEMLQTCDAALVIAPETNGVLANLTRMVETAGVKNLGCTQLAVDIASNKYDTYHQLNNANILTIPTYAASEFLQPNSCYRKLSSNQSLSNGYVVKPIDGAGCEDTLYFNDVVAVQAWLSHDSDASLDLDRQVSHQNRNQDKYIVQPYQAGTPASISMLCKQGKAWVLSCNQQHIEIQTTKDNEAAIQYKGCQVNSLSMHHAAFAKLADSIAVVIPGLNGYVGVDVIIEGEDIYVVEINPRITTSYIGLRESLDYNPAKLILDLACNQTFKLPKNITSKTVEISVNE